MNTTTVPLWEMEALHEPSHKRRTIRGDDPYLVLRKVNEQQQIWARRWQQKLSLERRRQEQELLCRTPEEFQALALARQQELEAQWQQLLTLSSAISEEMLALDVSSLRDETPFTLARPAEPRAVPLPPEPLASAACYQPEVSRMDKLFKKVLERKQQEAAAAFARDHENWQQNKQHIEANNAVMQQRYQESLQLWELRREQFLARQQMLNDRVVEYRRAYLAGEAWAVVDRCDRLLAVGPHPDGFVEEWELEYLADERTLLLEYRLPAPSELPRVAQISYDSSRKGLAKTFLTQEERNGRYDQVLYQLVLANLQLLLAGDEAGVIDRIQFTGWLEGSLSDGLKGRITLLTLTLDKAAVAAALARQGNELGGVVFEELYRLQGITPLRQIDRLARPRLPASRGVAELEQDASPEQAS